MSLKFVDHFIYAGVSYDISYDTAANNIVAQTTGGSPVNPIPGRGTSALTAFCSDNPSTTLVSPTSSPNYPYATFTTTPNSTSCPTGGGGTGSPTNITSLNVTNETASGASNGTLTINATSTIGGLTYSINGTTYQTSNYFSALAPGNYTAYAKDSSGNIASQPFTVSAYSNPVQTFSSDLPIVQLGSNISKWNAAFNPIYVNFQRKDFTVGNITQASGGIYVQISLTSAQAADAINNGVYLKTAKYDYFGKATAYDPTNGLTLPAYYSSNDNGGFLNIPVEKTGYYIEATITTANALTIVTQFYANQKGNIRADFAPYLRTLLSNRETNPFTISSFRDANLGGSFTLKYREVWDTGTSTVFSAPYPFYYTYAAMQLQEQYGGNMANYVPFQTAVQKAKWLTDFAKPIFHKGLPFELSFIYSEDLINQRLYLELVPDCGVTTTSLLLNADAGFLLNADNSRFIIETTYNSNLNGQSIIAALGINRLLIPSTFDCCAKNIVANIYYNNNGQSLFNGQVNETPGGGYVDVDGYNYQNGVAVQIDYGGTATPVYMNAGDSYTIQAQTNNTTYPTNAKVRLTVTRTIGTTTVTLHDEQIPAVTGGSIQYSGIAQPGATYQWTVTGLVTTTPVTTVNVADNNPVTAGKTYVMQPITIKHVCDCTDPYVYLKWINHLGAWDFYRFGFNQVNGATTTGSQQVSRNVTNWETAQTIEEFISRQANKKIALVAGQVNASDMAALEWMANSIKVQMLDNGKWKTVIIPDGDFAGYETRKGIGNVKFSITLPAKNIQSA